MSVSSRNDPGSFSDALVALLQTEVSWFGGGNGSGRNSTVSITLKIALLAPIPSARVRIAMMVKAGAFANIRNAYFRSVNTKSLFSAQCLHRIDKCSATRRQKTGEERGGGEQYGRAAEQCRIVRGNLIELRGDQTTERKRNRNPDRKTDDHRSHSLINNQPQHIARLRAERHSDADFTGPLLHRVSDSAINSDASEQKRDSGKNSQQPHHQARLAECLRHNRVHRLGNCDGQPGIDRAQRRLHHFRHRILPQWAAHRDHGELNILLGPRTIDFDFVRFRNAPCPHVTHHTDDLDRRARKRDEKRFTDRVVVAENFAGTRLADQHHVLVAGNVVLIELASRHDGYAEGLKIVRRDLMVRGGGPFIHRQNFSVRAGVKHVTGGGGNEWDVAADRGALETRDRA